jgi:sporulation protein YunB
VVIRLFIIFDRNLRPTILSVATARADIYATEAINDAVSEQLARKILYQDLILLQKDREGRIILAQINSMEVNRLMTETTMRVQESLLSLKGEVIYIPLGQALGSYLLAHYGPRIPITLVPIGRVNTDIIDTFEHAGINQVRHKLYFDIHAEVQVVIPFVSSVIMVSTAVPIVDAIYPGEVPDTVINLQFPGGFSQPLPMSPGQ